MFGIVLIVFVVVWYSFSKLLADVQVELSKGLPLHHCAFLTQLFGCKFSLLLLSFCCCCCCCAASLVFSVVDVTAIYVGAVHIAAAQLYCNL